MRAPSLRGPDPRVVAILRFAFLLGAGLFGGVIGYLRSQGGVSGDAELARAMTLAGRAVWAVALAACLLLAARVRAAHEPERVFAQSVVGWAIAESTAIFGGVYWYLVGSSQWYFSGLGFLALALIMLPGMRRAA
ncbi:MAG: hypothetical protein ACRENH_05205 [Gemmatimonadaceae bacterium]